MNKIILNYRTEEDKWVIDFNVKHENFEVFKAFLHQFGADIQESMIENLVLCMRQSNKGVLAQAVVDYMQEIGMPIKTKGY